MYGALETLPIVPFSRVYLLTYLLTYFDGASDSIGNIIANVSLACV